MLTRHLSPKTGNRKGLVPAGLSKSPTTETLRRAAQIRKEISWLRRQLEKVLSIPCKQP